MATATLKRKAEKEVVSKEMYVTVLACPVCKRWHVFPESVMELKSVNPERMIVCERFSWQAEHKFMTKDAEVVSEKVCVLEPRKKPLTEEEVAELKGEVAEKRVEQKVRGKKK
jgi:hypothetical protein